MPVFLLSTTLKPNADKLSIDGCQQLENVVSPVSKIAIRPSGQLRMLNPRTRIIPGPWIRGERHFAVHSAVKLDHRTDRTLHQRLGCRAHSFPPQRRAAKLQGFPNTGLPRGLHAFTSLCKHAVSMAATGRSIQPSEANLLRPVRATKRPLHTKQPSIMPHIQSNSSQPRNCLRFLPYGICFWHV